MKLFDYSGEPRRIFADGSIKVLINHIAKMRKINTEFAGYILGSLMLIAEICLLCGTPGALQMTQLVAYGVHY